LNQSRRIPILEGLAGLLREFVEPGEQPEKRAFLPELWLWTKLLAGLPLTISAGHLIGEAEIIDL
jgi:hypothetical protein